MIVEENQTRGKGQSSRQIFWGKIENMTIRNVHKRVRVLLTESSNQNRHKYYRSCVFTNGLPLYYDRIKWNLDGCLNKFDIM